ncbi:hypothetical protein DFP72DRAFT_1084092 [Ephemerocybe angulata]|uniref:Uncharacterized protein n=1 Tax=Ephemerocybe angulata TaxID=980116 RepID=A0A8H6H8B1_9AGAR|nr:hypothetical protein DFP72DRAFT_1084092 [Tulosesus angulatus]
MNWLYDGTEAKLWLDSYVQRSLQEDVTENVRFLNQVDIEECSVAEYGEPPCMRLVKNINGITEEVTVRVPGILCSKTLPPVHALRSTKAEHVRYLRQFVRLTALGSESFNLYEGVFASIQDAFAAAPAVTEVEPFDFGVYEGYYGVDLHARYLTERRFVPSQRHIPFTADVDPNSVLEEARGGKFIRVEDNVVQYSRKVEEGDGTTHYEPCLPEDFREGDIVETTGTFVAFPTGRGGEYKMVFCLRSLTMLTSMFREKSRISKAVVPVKDPREGRKRKRAKPPTAQSLKRSFIKYGRRNDSSGGNREDSTAMME